MPLPLRADFSAPDLRRAARRTKDAAQGRRLLALASIYDGGSRTEAAKLGGVTLQIVRDWVMKFNAHGANGLIDRKAPGQPSRLNGVHRAALAVVIESGPTPAIHGVVRWRLVDLCQWLWTSSASASPSRRSAGNCAPWATGSSRPGRAIMPRPRGRSRVLKKFPRPPGSKGIGPTDIEVWFADEARIGQKNKITRRSAKRGTRPVAAQDQRTRSAYLAITHK